MDLKLQGKRALVTSFTAGIGFAIAKGLAREGAAVVVNGRTEAKVSDAVKRIDTKASVTGVAGDFGGAAEVDRLLAKLEPVDILINNAGIFEPMPFLDIPDSDWLRFFEVNVMSGIRLSRALLPHMLKQNWRRIIFISSESGLHLPAEMVHYGMTKTAQLARSRGIAESIPGTGVTVRRAAQTDADGGRERFCGELGEGPWCQREGDGSRGDQQDAAPLLADQALGHARGSGQPGGLSLQRGRLGNDRCSASGGWQRAGNSGFADCHSSA